MRRATLLVVATLLAVATEATAQDVRAGKCAGVDDVQASPSYVGVGGAWVNVADCVGPR